jgi:dGTPase
MSIRERLEKEEDERLAPYAVRSSSSRGRVYDDIPHPYRTAFQRDRDKVIHTPAFRRLAYKTQVFLNFEGDSYRTRLTHTLEASQIARTIARALRLNEDLTEAITLAHDLGHPPFGHAGEEALDALLREAGDSQGFEHNRHSLRLVDELEGRHPRYPGLNLSWEVREGITKHRFPVDEESADTFVKTAHASLEAQVADIADAVAYSCHDVDDALQAGLLKPQELATLPLWAEALHEIGDRYGDLRPEHLRGRAVEYLIERLATDVVEESQRVLKEAGVAGVADVRRSMILSLASPELGSASGRANVPTETLATTFRS